MSSTIAYKKGAIAQCADNRSPTVTTSQWACVTRIKSNNMVEELYVFDDEQGAKDCKQWVADGCPLITIHLVITTEETADVLTKALPKDDYRFKKFRGILMNITD